MEPRTRPLHPSAAMYRCTSRSQLLLFAPRSRCWATVCLLLALVALPASADAAGGWLAKPESPHPAVARVSAPEKGAISFGSGTLVYAEGEYGLVVTNWHVVRDATGEIGVVFPSGFHSTARVAKIDRDWDLAALIVWRPPSIEPVSLSVAPPQLGDSLTIAGYGSGNYRSARGRCTQYVAPGMNLPFEMVEVSAQARQGDSGGPIFNDRGELAGVLFGAGNGTTSGSYCGRVHQFLASVAPKVGQPTLDVSNIAAAIQKKPNSTAQPVAQPLDNPVANLRENRPPRFGTPAFVAPPLYEPPSDQLAAAQPSVNPLQEPVASMGVVVAPTKTPPSFDADVFAPPTIAAKSEPAGETAPVRTGNVAPVETPSHPESTPSLAPPAESLDDEYLYGGDLVDAAGERNPEQEISPAESASWQQVLGASLVDQAKTFLALFGVIAFVYHAARRIGTRDEE